MATDKRGQAVAAGDQIVPLFTGRQIDAASFRDTFVHGLKHLLSTSDDDFLRAQDLIDMLDNGATLAQAKAHGASMLGWFMAWNLGNPVTLAPVFVDSAQQGTGRVDTQTYRIVLPVACRIIKVAVRATTFTGGEPADWTLNIYKNGSLTTTGTFGLATNPSYAKTVITLGSPATFAAGDDLYFTVSGSGINAIGATIHPWIETT